MVCEDARAPEHDLPLRIESAIAAGAATINIPDTVGYAYPEEFADLIRMIRNRVPNIDQAVISVHCHNDLGLGVALRAIEAGARQVECTINGIGERAGNAAMEEIVMALRTRHDLLPYSTRIVTQHITRASRLVSAITGFAIQPNKAIVGQRCATRGRHPSGRHAQGRGTYEIMRPEDVGLVRSAGHGQAPGRRLRQLASWATSSATTPDRGVRSRPRDKKKEIFDEDLIALVDDEIQAADPHIKVLELDVHWRRSASPARSPSRSAASGARPRRRATARSTPPSTPSSSWCRTAPSWRCSRSTP